jgi:hypothetical protein
MTKRDTRLLHIIIGAAPTGAVSLQHDLRMTKAALLYADRTKLCSPTSSMTLQMLLSGETNRNRQHIQPCLCFAVHLMWKSIDDSEHPC